MANVKISQLPVATIPLVGTEEVPLVQGGVTKRATIDNIIGGVQNEIVTLDGRVDDLESALGGAAFSNVYASTAAALSNGVLSTAAIVGGSGGTNGTFDVAFSGGGGTGAAARFTVSGGALVSIVITNPGTGYTSAPTLSFAASSGLTSASATVVIGARQPVGTYFYVTGPGESLLLYRVDAGPVATFISAIESTAVFNELNRQSYVITNANSGAWASPSSLTTLLYTTGGGAVTPTGLDTVAGAARALQVQVTAGNASSVGGVLIDAADLASGDIVRIDATYQSGTGTPYFSLGFGTSSAARGFGWRTTAQINTIDLPSGAVGGLFTGPPPTFTTGDRVSIDARLQGGTAGNWTVRFYCEKAGERYGPYDVTGIASLDNAWFMSRSINIFTDIRLTRWATPRYRSELWPSVEPTLYVSTTGSDSNSGTSVAAPLLNIQTAVNRAGPGTIIEIAGGEYRQAVDLSGQINIWLRAPHNQRVIILGSNQLSPVTKTGGYTQVYQAPLAAKPTGMGGSRGAPMIFEWGTPSKPIPSDERHPLQRGEANRLPYTEMLEAPSLADVDTLAGRGTWWWDSGVIYFAATDGGDATLGRYETRVRVPITMTSGGFARLTRVDAYFSSDNGMRFRGNLGIVREDCRSFGNYRNGFGDDCAIIRSYKDEGAGNGNDGVNGTPVDYAGTGNRDVTASAIYYDPWLHDNYDDGLSFHTRGDCTSYGGLYEYNTKAGIVHVLGSGSTAYDPFCRRSDFGVYAATAPDDSRVQTTIAVNGARCEDNDYNFAAVSAVLLAQNCISQRAGVAGYYEATSGRLDALNCFHSGGTARSGTVVVTNVPALT